MRDSGCEVPEYMLEVKKYNRKTVKKLEHVAPKRKTISTRLKHRRRFKDDNDSSKGKQTNKKFDKKQINKSPNKEIKMKSPNQEKIKKGKTENKKKTNPENTKSSEKKSSTEQKKKKTNPENVRETFNGKNQKAKIAKKTNILLAKKVKAKKGSKT